VVVMCVVWCAIVCKSKCEVVCGAGGAWALVVGGRRGERMKKEVRPEKGKNSRKDSCKASQKIPKPKTMAAISFYLTMVLLYLQPEQQRSNR